MPWSPEVQAHVTTLDAAAPPPNGAWEHAVTPALRALEAWGTALARIDRRAGVNALVAAVQFGLPQAIEAGGEEAREFGLVGTEADPIVDGAAAQVQIARAARWVATPDDATRAAVEEAYSWYLDAGQCCCAAILAADDGRDSDSYYYWPAAWSVGRGLVVTARGLGDDDATVATVRAAILSAF